MKTRTKYAIPSIIGMVTVMAFIVPAMAEQTQFASTLGSDSEPFSEDPLQYMKLVSGFEGTVQIQFEPGAEQRIEELINVSLADAAVIAEENGLVHATDARMEAVKNERGDAYLTWVIHGYDSARSETVGHSPDIFVVDAGDATNFVLTTKEWNLPDVSYTQETQFFEGFEEDYFQPTGDVENDALRAEFLDLMQQLKDAQDENDPQKVEQVRLQIQELYTGSMQIANPDR